MNVTTYRETTQRLLLDQETLVCHEIPSSKEHLFKILSQIIHQEVPNALEAGMEQETALIDIALKCQKYMAVFLQHHPEEPPIPPEEFVLRLSSAFSGPIRFLCIQNTANEKVHLIPSYLDHTTADPRLAPATLIERKITLEPASYIAIPTPRDRCCISGFNRHFNLFWLHRRCHTFLHANVHSNPLIVEPHHLQGILIKKF